MSKFHILKTQFTQCTFLSYYTYMSIHNNAKRNVTIRIRYQNYRRVVTTLNYLIVVK